MTAQPVLSACFSMTGYANVKLALPTAQAHLELRSVNSRFLDLSFRLPDEWRIFESHLREKISSAVLRGKVECRISLQQEKFSNASTPKPALIAKLNHWQTQVLELVPNARPLSVTDIFHWPGVMQETELENEVITTALEKALTHCLTEFLASRQREGQKLGEILLGRCAQIDVIIQDLQLHLPNIRSAYQQRAREKLNQALGLSTAQGSANLPTEELQQRLSTEVALYAMRSDVDEELERLKSHLQEVQRIVSTANKNSLGKRLDFLMQELHREANTLGSKAVTLELSNAALEIKLLIEQMREQVQNIE